MQQRFLNDNNRICIIGGGPAGSFFAIHLLQAAALANLKIMVTIIDKNGMDKSKVNVPQLKGCNYCAGLISPGLYKAMSGIGIILPKNLIMESYTHFWFQGLWKNFPLKIPREEPMVSVFRGKLPRDRKDDIEGFDSFLLKKAKQEGASFITGEVLAIMNKPSEIPCLTVRSPSGSTFALEADFIAVATGINAGTQTELSGNPLLKTLRNINPEFRSPRVRRALIFELRPGKDYLKKYMDKEIYFIESGSKSFDLEHIALVPKREYLTVALVGKAIESATLPDQAFSLIQKFLSLAHIKAILPHLNMTNTPVTCFCTPYMAEYPCTCPLTDRIACVGDLLGARLYKDGLYSAFTTAQALAQTIVNNGIDKGSLLKGYGRVHTWLEKDNRYGKRVFNLTRIAFNSPGLSRILYQSFATEMKSKTMEKRPLGSILWKIGAGTAGYQTIYRELMKTGVIRSILTGAFKTLRNVLTEIFFDIRWKDYGRYPTVILKEKRNHFKQSISAPLRLSLDPSFDLERMYAIKIRASAQIIFEELGRFGMPDAPFLKLRFIDVSRVKGEANQHGSVIRYKLKLFPLFMDIRLLKSIPGRSLLYQPEELFTQKGSLIFDIHPTRDGNNRLVIYTAFNFKRGSTWPSRFFWTLFKYFFPGFAHDVVWNHAICSIKGEAERRSPEMQI